MKHFVLTRFNIPFIRKENIDFLFSEDYLEKRFRIFREFCFESMKLQTSQNFEWLVFFDIRTPNRYKQINEEWQKQMPNYHPIYLDMDLLSNEYDNPVFMNMTMETNRGISSVNELSYGDYTIHVTMAAYISDLINSFCDTHVQNIITTRIDNDDSFHCSMIKNIQDEISKRSEVNYVLSFDNGYQYIAGSSILQTFYYPNSHFTSYIEHKSDHLQTILYWDHFFVDKYKKVVHVDNKLPLWIEICHDSNVVNSLSTKKGNHIVWGNINLRDYGIKKNWSSLNTLINILSHPTLFLLPNIRNVIKKLVK